MKENVKDIKKRLKSAPDLIKLLKRPGVGFKDIMEIANWKDELSYYVKTQAEVDMKYEGYIRRELSYVNKFKKIERIHIPENFDYSRISGLSNEIREKLSRFKPKSLGQASRISGVTPVAISLLMVKLATR